MNTIKIFLASSEELREDRKAFKSFLADENALLQKKGALYELVHWENFIDAVSVTRLQDEYNKKIPGCHLFVLLFWSKVGKYTEEEFDTARTLFKLTEKPRIYTYFNSTPVTLDTPEKIAGQQTVTAFRQKLIDLGHFETKYGNIQELLLHFKQQLDKLFDEKVLNYGKPPRRGPKPFNTEPGTPQCLYAGQPPVTCEFLGRDRELADLKDKLTKQKLLLLHGDGGMGKTTLAAKYLEDNTKVYNHYAWLFCENGIISQVTTLSGSLGIDLTQIPPESQLPAIKTALQRLPPPCLLVLDNANTPEDIREFLQQFGGLHWQVLITARGGGAVPGANSGYHLEQLSAADAAALFKKYYSEESETFENLLNRLLKNIGYNTLLIEIFAKNLNELAAIENLADFVQQLEEKGLFLGDRSFEIHTYYTGNVHKTAATTDDVLNILYDLTQLKEEQRRLLVNLSLLPAESHELALLAEVLGQQDKEGKLALAKILKNLAKKGWLGTDSKTYRISPVVQQIALNKNQESIQDDVATLLGILNKKLKHDGASLVNLTYDKARPYAELAKGFVNSIKQHWFNTALLCLNLSDYYKGIGNHIEALLYLAKATDAFEKIDKENYTICLSRLGTIYQQQGDFKKALQFFELQASLFKELFEANPHSENLKNGLAISYSKLGDIYQQQGDFKKALQFFELDLSLTKELFEANPHSENLKNGLAISYEKLGDIYQQQGDFKKALQFFELQASLFKELFEANPHSENLKNGLAISYSKLGDIYQQQGDFKKALQFFELRAQLAKELFEANPHSENLKNGLAISYEKLGDIYQEQGDFKKALQFFELRAQLAKELFEANPDSVGLYNGLAVSYSRMGLINKDTGNHTQARQYFQMAESIWVELVEKTSLPEYQSNLNWTKTQLQQMHGDESITE